MDVDYSMLVNYGVLGLWTVHTLWRENGVIKAIKESLDRNTQVLTNISMELTRRGKR